jgi:hypothetical protein
MAVLCVRPITKVHLFEKISTKFAIASEQLENILQYFLDKQFIFYINNIHEVDNYFNSAKSWESAGWNIAAHYHFFTQDTPYLDYSETENALKKVTNQMVAYHALEPDIERYKKYTTNLGIQKLPCIKDCLNTYELSRKT